MFFNRKFQITLAITLCATLVVIVGFSLKRDYTPNDKLNNVNSSIDNPSTPKNNDSEQPTNTPEIAELKTADKDVEAKTEDDKQPDKSLESTDPQNTENQEENKNKQAEENAQENPEPQKTTNETTGDKTKSYTHNAEPGDSYTAIARRSIKQYATENNLQLSPDQIEGTASKLAINAGSPFLEIGQTVTIAQGDISALVNTKPQPATPTTPESPKDNLADKDTTTPETFEFSASTNDSYALLARKAIIKYTTDINLNLSSAQRIAAETFIISDSGFPSLEIDQKVTFTSEAIKDAVNKASNLTDTQISLWQPYADLATL